MTKHRRALTIRKRWKILCRRFHSIFSSMCEKWILIDRQLIFAWRNSVTASSLLKIYAPSFFFCFSKISIQSKSIGSNQLPTNCTIGCSLEDNKLWSKKKVDIHFSCLINSLSLTHRPFLILEDILVRFN